MMNNLTKKLKSSKVIIIIYTLLQIYFILLVYVRVSEIKWFLTNLHKDLAEVNLPSDASSNLTDQIEATFDIAEGLSLPLLIAGTGVVIYTIVIWRKKLTKA